MRSGAWIQPEKGQTWRLTRLPDGRPWPTEMRDGEERPLPGAEPFTLAYWQAFSTGGGIWRDTREYPRIDAGLWDAGCYELVSPAEGGAHEPGIT